MKIQVFISQFKIQHTVDIGTFSVLTLKASVYLLLLVVVSSGIAIGAISVVLATAAAKEALGLGAALRTINCSVWMLAKSWLTSGSCLGCWVTSSSEHSMLYGFCLRWLIFGLTRRSLQSSNGSSLLRLLLLSELLNHVEK